MKIILLFSILILVVFSIVRIIFHSAKRNLFKDQASWSGEDINIRYSQSKGNSVSKRDDNYLKIIAEESKVYLEDQSKQEAEWNQLSHKRIESLQINKNVPQIIFYK